MRIDPQQPELLRVCRGRTCAGIKGEVTVLILPDEPEYRFAPGAVLYTKDGEEEYVVGTLPYLQTAGSSLRAHNRDSSEVAKRLCSGEADDPERRFRPRVVIERPDQARLADDNTGARTRYGDGKVVDVLAVAQWLLKIRPAGSRDADGVVVENRCRSSTLVPDIRFGEGYFT